MVTAGQGVVLGLFVVAAATMSVFSVRKARRSTASEPADVDPVRIPRRRLAVLVVAAAGAWLLFRESDDAKAERLTQERAVTSLSLWSCEQQGGGCAPERARAKKVQADYDEFFGSRP